MSPLIGNSVSTVPASSSVGVVMSPISGPGLACSPAASSAGTTLPLIAEAQICVSSGA